MKRPALTALAPLVLASLLAGCSSWEEVLQDNPLSEKAFVAGAVIGGAPAVTACAPITLPLAMSNNGREGIFYVLLPGIPTAVVGGVALGLPTLIVESVLRLPGRIWRHARGEGCDPPPIHEVELEVEDAEEPEPEPEPEAAQEEDPYQHWPNPRYVPD